MIAWVFSMASSTEERMAAILRCSCTLLGATRGLSKRSRKEDSLWYLLRCHTGPPWWINGCVNSISTTRRPLFSTDIGPFLNNPG